MLTSMADQRDGLATEQQNNLQKAQRSRGMYRMRRLTHLTSPRQVWRRQTSRPVLEKAGVLTFSQKSNSQCDNDLPFGVAP
jgi:hypothetical protein